MGMMSNLRSNTHIILWILVLAFVGLIVFEWGANFSGGRGAGAPKYIAKINGREIKPQQYFQLLQQQYEQTRNNNNGDLSDQQRKQIQSQLWDQLVNETLVQQAVKDRDIVVTDQDILRELRTNPPDVLKNVEAFQTDGKFDKQKYLQALNNPVGDEWVQIENYVRASLPAQKLQSVLLASVNVSENEVKAAYRKQNIKYTVDYLEIPLRSISDEAATPSSAEVEKYYNDHLDEFRVPEKRQLRYAKFPKTPSAEDTAAAKTDAMDVLEQAKKGIDFAQLAKDYSDGPSASQGGELGWFGRSQMVKPFADAAFAGKPGEIVGPVETRFGYHIIKIEDKRKQNGEEQVKASHILLKITASGSTIDRQKSRAALFLFDAQDYGIEASADSNHVQLQQTQPFAKDAQFIPGLGQLSEATDFAFSHPVGKISDDVVDADDAFYVFQVSDIQAPTVQPLDEVKTRIVRRLTTEKKQQMAYQRAQELRSKLSADANLEQIGEDSTDINYNAPQPFTLSGSVPGVGKNAEFLGTVEALNTGELSPAVNTSRGSFIIRLKSQTDFNQEKYAQQKDEIRQRLTQQKQSEFLNNWLAALKDKADIVDNRDAFM